MSGDELQPGYVDAETRLAAWLHDRLKCKIWCDPLLPANWKFTAPIGHLLRSASEGDTYLTLDSGIYDLDFYAADPAHARKLAEQARWEIRYNLPLYTWADGITVNGTATISPPAWRPDPAVARRGSTYRIILHGVITPVPDSPFTDGGNAVIADLDHAGLTVNGSVLTVDTDLTGSTANGSILTVTV